mgnify:CR=1 FL=1
MNRTKSQITHSNTHTLWHWKPYKPYHHHWSTHLIQFFILILNVNCEWIFDRRCFGHKQMLMIIMMVANACINGEENKILAISKIPYFVDNFFSFFLTNFFAFHDFVWFIIIIRTSHNSNVWFNEFSMKNHLYLFILDRNCDKKTNFFFANTETNWSKREIVRERNKNHFSSYFFFGFSNICIRKDSFPDFFVVVVASNLLTRRRVVFFPLVHSVIPNTEFSNGYFRDWKSNVSISIESFILNSLFC